jgi:hypothetical protein
LDVSISAKVYVVYIHKYLLFFEKGKPLMPHILLDIFGKVMTEARILTSNSVGAQLFFLGCNQDNNHGSNFITKKKICLVHQKRKLAIIEINKFLI